MLMIVSGYALLVGGGGSSWKFKVGFQQPTNFHTYRYLLVTLQIDDENKNTSRVEDERGVSQEVDVEH